MNFIDVSIQESLSKKLRLTAPLFARERPLLQMNFIKVSLHVSLTHKLNLTTILFARKRLFLHMNRSNMLLQTSLHPKLILIPLSSGRVRPSPELKLIIISIRAAHFERLLHAINFLA